ncbi:hypothetical protein V6N13_054464 [Hibiscus sabdariffa]
MRCENGCGGQNSKQDEMVNRAQGKQSVVSLFVENIPEEMHCKGLWYSFARHGEVESVYIAWKRSRGGKRFGFVRMGDKKDADRIIERLHGFKLYGSSSTLTVKYERNSLVQPGRSTERKNEFGSELGRSAGRNKEISIEAARET